MNKVGVTFNYYPVNSLDHVDQKSNPLDFSTLVTFTVNHYHQYKLRVPSWMKVLW